jgi:hypothetical protein
MTGRPRSAWSNATGNHCSGGLSGLATVPAVRPDGVAGSLAGGGQAFRRASHRRNLWRQPGVTAQGAYARRGAKAVADSQAIENGDLRERLATLVQGRVLGAGGPG